MPDPSHADQTEAEFLKHYRAERYAQPSVTADVVLFEADGGSPSVLLIQRGGHPFRGAWALPGGFVDVVGGPTGQGETLQEAALRELGEEVFARSEDALSWTSALFRRHGVALQQLGAFGAPGRDPRGRVISVAFWAVVPADLRALVVAGDDAAVARWVAVDQLAELSLAFDHGAVLAAALRRLAER